jgi:hypothetical protein
MQECDGRPVGVEPGLVVSKQGCCANRDGARMPPLNLEGHRWAGSDRRAAWDRQPALFE